MHATAAEFKEHETKLKRIKLGTGERNIKGLGKRQRAANRSKTTTGRHEVNEVKSQGLEGSVLS